MFQIGEQVIYGTEGVCRVERIETLHVGKQSGRYYVLSPIDRRGSTVYVPLDNERLTARIKRILTAEELNALLDAAADEALLWLEDANERKALYTQVLLDGDRRKLLRLMRTLYLRRVALVQRGKHLRAADEQALRDAERTLNGEFALVLNIPRHEVPAYLHARLGATA